jgi:hypothetical protein
MHGIKKLFSDFLGDNSFTQSAQYPAKPFWVTAITADPDLIREDVMTRVKAWYGSNQERIMSMRFNMAAYAGLQHFSDDVRAIATQGLQPRLVGQSARITSNHVQRLVDTQVTDILKQPQDITVLPMGDRFEDGVLAEMVQEMLESINNTQQQTQIAEMLHRRARLCGEAYRWMFWDAQAGGEHPSSKKLREKEKVVRIEGTDGKMHEIKSPVMQGDVGEEHPFVWDVGMDPQPKPWMVQWCFKKEFCPVDELKVDYPEFANEIIPHDNATTWSDHLMQPQDLRDHALKITFYARSSKYLPEGYKVVCTPTVTLEHGPSDMPHCGYSMWGNLPIERITDADLDSVLHGWSRLRNINQLQNQYDNSTTLIGQNIFIAARPKWMFPAGSVNMSRLANKETMVPFKGPQAPQLVTSSSVPNEVFLYKDSIKKDMEQTYGVHPIAAGEVPKGVTATSALQFLDEEQQKAGTMQQLKNEEFTIATHTKRLALMRENYDVSDKRFSTILHGQDWKVKYFDVKALQCDCKVQMKVGSDLPKRKDALMQTVFQMSQIWPNLFPDEAVADMFKIGHAKRFINEARAAWQSGEDENFRASRGEKLEDPEAWENVLVHWRAHAKQLQLPEFKQWPEDRKDILIKHQMTTEFLMLLRLRQNPVFAAQVQQLPSWPMTLTLPPDFGGPQASVEGGAIAPGQLELPGDGGAPDGSQAVPAQAASNAGVNQIRFPNGQFGNRVEEVR